MTKGDENWREVVEGDQDTSGSVSCVFVYMYLYMCADANGGVPVPHAWRRVSDWCLRCAVTNLHTKYMYSVRMK